MESVEELDQFEVLEQKLDSLIKYVQTLKKEKETLSEQLQIQEGKISNMAGEIGSLRSARDQAKQKIISLLEKIEQLDVDDL
jgi:uncharacterized coiled-coil DUF342 family protein